MTYQICRVLEDQGTDLALRVALANAAHEYANALFLNISEKGFNVAREEAHHTMELICQEIINARNN